MSKPLRLCLELNNIDPPIKLEQHTNKAARFRVTYGLEVVDELSYEGAARRLGGAILHALACAGRIDNAGE